ncbi:hypothetical protein [Methanofollis fontis]|uniref:Uncharacterized protein n=1 Tax=Methanofollis fontis TaxID=2052832 RepID=A0A483CPQ7_9EURY|nr:hypothetical protein [Methanofollis fontis]TAJ44990.1 hypothetical protein CUJ86_06855 [Methanofollis fontis]
MPDSWTRTLQAYCYQVNLKEYHKRENFPGYFNQEIYGDRRSTMAFEDYFRSHSSMIEPWYEVVLWKMYSQKYGNGQGDRIIRQIPRYNAEHPENLRSEVDRFRESLDQTAFESLASMLGYKAAFAMVATFTAFIDPEQFPMVDRHVAAWVNKHYARFNAANPNAPELIPFASGKTWGSPSLTIEDFSSYVRWIFWTRYAVEVLSRKTGVHWRARDVEMAVFTAGRGRFTLNPLRP